MSIVIDQAKLIEAAGTLDTSETRMRELKRLVEDGLKDFPNLVPYRYEVRVSLNIGVYAFGLNPDTGKECLLHRRCVAPDLDVECGPCP